MIARVAAALGLVLIWCGATSGQANETGNLNALVSGRTIAPGTCVSNAKLDCSALLKKLQRGAIAEVSATQIFQSRSDELFKTLFPNCRLENDQARNGNWTEAAYHDPLLYENSDGQFLPFGPFQVYEVSLNGKIAKVISATGFLRPSSGPIRATAYYLFDPHRPCSPFLVATDGYFDEVYAADRWSRVIELGGAPYTASVDQVCNGCREASVHFTAIPDITNSRPKRARFSGFSIR